MKLRLVILNIVNLLDIISTYIAVGHFNLIEYNPFMAILIAAGMEYFVGFKLLVIGGVTKVLLKTKETSSTRIATTIGIAALGIAALNNFILIYLLSG